jgi:hypothetical protein
MQTGTRVSLLEADDKQVHQYTNLQDATLNTIEKECSKTWGTGSPRRTSPQAMTGIDKLILFTKQLNEVYNHLLPNVGLVRTAAAGQPGAFIL